MSQSVFPILQGMTPEATVAPRFSTKIQQSVSGRETRAAFMAYPLWDITLAFEVLSKQDLDILSGFFLQMQGSLNSFLVQIPDDNSVSDMQFGIGDGGRVTFQLTRIRGGGGFGFAEPCENLASLSNIKVDGTLLSASNYSVSSSGVVTFVTAPAAGVVLTWSGGYYYRCRFTDDTADFERFMLSLWRLQSLKMTGAPGNRV